MDYKRIVIVGATSEIAKHCARLFIKNDPREMLLLGRNEEKLNSLLGDLKVRGPNVKFSCIKTSFTDPSAIETLVANIYEAGPVDLVLIAQGSLADQQACQENLSLCHQTLLINGISPVLFAETFAKHMAQANIGTIALIGSVAGDRGRRSNYIYGAGKGLIERYVQGLQHRFANTAVHVLLAKPGPTDTPMTAGFKAQGKRLATAERVAELIVEGIQKKKSIIYAPSLWKYIMLVIRGLPNVIFTKLDI